MIEKLSGRSAFFIFAGTLEAALTRHHLPSKHSHASNLLPVFLLPAIQRVPRWNPNTLFTILGFWLSLISDQFLRGGWQICSPGQDDHRGRSAELGSVSAVTTLPFMAVIQTPVIPPPSRYWESWLLNHSSPTSSRPDAHVQVLLMFTRREMEFPLKL